VGGSRSRDKYERQSAHPHRGVAGAWGMASGSTLAIQRTLSRVCAELEHTYGLTSSRDEKVEGCPG